MIHVKIHSLLVQLTFTTAYLLNTIVIASMFKARLDKFWMHQDDKYDSMADLTTISVMRVHKLSGLSSQYLSTYVRLINV